MLRSNPRDHSGRDPGICPDLESLYKIRLDLYTV